MRKIRIMEHMSLDGVISMGGWAEDSEFARGDWNGDWTAPFRTVEGAEAVYRSYGENFDLLLGRRTYDLWADFFPTMQGGPFADRMNAATKYVVTHRPESLEWGPVGNLGVDIMEGILRLKAQDGPDLAVCGSASLTSTLLEQALVDEVVLAVYPVLLGRGKRIFLADSGVPHEFTLANSQTTPTGVFLNTYRYIGTRQTD